VEENKRELLRQNAMYYTLLFFLLVFIAGAAILLVPVIALATSYLATFIIAILGLAYGLFVTYFIKELDMMTKHHHAGIWAVFIFGTLLNFSLISPRILGATTVFLTGYVSTSRYAFIFSLGFLLPYFLYLHDEARKNNVERFKDV